MQAKASSKALCLACHRQSSLDGRMKRAFRQQIVQYSQQGAIQLVRKRNALRVPCNVYKCGRGSEKSFLALLTNLTAPNTHNYYATKQAVDPKLNFTASIGFISKQASQYS